jgi:hypothetical protein
LFYCFLNLNTNNLNQKIDKSELAAKMGGKEMDYEKEDETPIPIKQGSEKML